MSNQERTHYLQQLRDTISTYKGFTIGEKQYALKHLNKWVSKNGNVEIFIKKFSEISLDIRPFLIETRFLQA